MKKKLLYISVLLFLISGFCLGKSIVIVGVIVGFAGAIILYICLGSKYLSENIMAYYLRISHF